jgi:hypothetical protein
MSSVKSKKLPRNDRSMVNYDIKKRTTENKSFPKKDVEKKIQKEDEKQKTKIDWEEEKDILKKYLSEKYPLSKKKIEKIINERAKKYIDMDKYQSYFLKNQSKNLTEKIKKSKKLSNAPDEIKSFFDLEAKESVDYSSSEDEENDNTDDDNVSTNVQSDEEIEEEDTSSTRKRKCEFSTLNDSSPKKKESLVVRWLPNGNKVNSKIFDIFTLMNPHILSVCIIK